MSDRIYVMAEGTVTGELPAEEATGGGCYGYGKAREVPVR